MPLLPHIEINPEHTANCSIIWLHGLGASGDDFVPVAKELQLSDHIQPRFIFPHAPQMPVTINNRMVMPAWYDIFSMEIDAQIDIPGILSSSNQIQQFIEREQQRGIASDKIVLAGFSQGGAVVYDCALSYPQPLAGLLILSSYFATYGHTQRHPANQKIPVCIYHGQDDPVVPVFLADKAKNFLQQQGYPVEHQYYPMQHSVCGEEILDISNWLNRILA